MIDPCGDAPVLEGPVSDPSSSLRIAIVGPCGAGKSTLARNLRLKGWQARAIAQEHSYVPSMWRRVTKPDLLIYLDASYDDCTRRRRLSWLPQEHAEELKRLAHARQHCDLYVATDGLTADGVMAHVLDQLGSLVPRRGAAHPDIRT
jgi:cytidylate kinase